MAFGLAVLGGHATRSRGYLLLCSPIVAYAFEHLWRIDTFQNGVAHFLLIALIAIPAFDAVFRGVPAQPLPYGSARDEALSECAARGGDVDRHRMARSRA